MFMLPPVPGVPVYIFGGAVIAPRVEFEIEGKSSAEMNTGFLVGTGASMIVSFFVKLAAVAGQQLLIGKRMGQRTTIRHTVGVHTPTIRAIEMILVEKG